MTVKTVTLTHPSNDVRRHLMARPLPGQGGDTYEVVSWHDHSYRYEARTTHPECYAFLALDEIIRYMNANGWIIWMDDRCCTEGLVCCCNIRTCSCTCAGCMCDTD